MLVVSICSCPSHRAMTVTSLPASNLVQSDVRSELVSQTQPRRIAAARSAPGAAGGRRPCPRTAVGLRRGRSTPTRATAWRSGALTLVPLPDQLLDRARQSRLEVDQLRPRRGHDDADHAVVERADPGLPLDPLLGRHLVGAARL